MHEHKKCSIDGCEGWAVSRTWCQMHYTRWQRHGDPLTKLVGDGFVKDGYHIICEEGKELLFHRVVMQAHLGRPLSSDELVHHKDGNRLNNRIDNLELMTRSQHAKYHHAKGMKLHPATKTDTHRWCGACKTVKPIEDFQKCRRNRSGVQAQCRQCRVDICHYSYMKSPRRAHITKFNQPDI